MRRSLLALLLLSCVISTARMQDKPRWPPHAQDIFDPSIEVLDFNMLDKAEQIPLGEIELIPELRAIRGADGHIYNWPESIEYFMFTYAHPIVIYDALYLYSTRHWLGEPETMWTLNFKTGVFAEYTSQEPPLTPCGKRWPRRMGWDIYADEKQSFLCNMSTGKKLPFPPNYRISRYQSSYESEPRMQTLTDGRLLILARHADDADINVLVQNSLTEQFDNIGKLPFYDDINIKIVNKTDNIALINIKGSNGAINYGVFNLSKNSLALYTPPIGDYSSLGLWDFWPNPTITTFKVTADGTCTWLVYDLETNKESSFDFGDLCFSEFTRKDGTRYFRQISPDKKTATVIRLNPLTNERQQIYSGEIEGVIWASDDDRYIMLITDNNGKVDTIPAARSAPYASSDASLKFIDRQHNITEWQTPAYVDQFTGMHWEPSVYSRIPNWLLVQESSYSPDKEDSLINLSSNSIKIRNLNIQSQINNEWASYQDESTIGLYHLEDERHIPIFNIPIDKYVLNSLIPLGDDRFEVKISYSNWPKEDPPDQKMASFIIRVPNINLPIGQNIPMYLYFEETA